MYKNNFGTMPYVYTCSYFNPLPFALYLLIAFAISSDPDLTQQNVGRLYAWLSTQSRLATLLFFLIARLWVGLQTLRRFRLKDLSIDEMVGV